MKIGIYDPYLDDLGGGEKYMMTIASCLSKDHDVSIFWDSKKDLEELVERFSLDISNLKLVPNIFSKSFGFIRKILETRKYDCIIILSDGSIPFVLSRKTFIHIQQPLPFVKPALKSKLKLLKINAVFTNSNYTKKFVDKELDVNSIVIYPPIDIRSRQIKKENIILNVGRLRVRDVVKKERGKIVAIGDYKKQGEMIDSFKKISKTVKDWKFIIATSVMDEDRNAFDILKKNAEGNPIEFLVNKNNKALWDIYNRAKIYWHASGFGEDLEKHPELAEHFGISTVEAMGGGTVPVVINAGGQKEIVQDGVNGFLWDSLEELEEKTLKLISDQKLLDKLSTKARERARLFSDDKFCDRIKDLINS